MTFHRSLLLVVILSMHYYYELVVVLFVVLLGCGVTNVCVKGHHRLFHWETDLEVLFELFKIYVYVSVTLCISMHFCTIHYIIFLMNAHREFINKLMLFTFVHY